MDINFSKSPGISQLPKTTGGPRNYLIESVLLLVVAGLFVWFIVLPKKAELSGKSEDLNKLYEQQAKIKSQAEELKNLVEKLKNSPVDIKNLDTAIPLSHNAIQFELLIKSMADAVNVSIGSLNIASKPDLVVAGDKALIDNPFGIARSLQKLSGSIYAMGNMDQLLAFLKKLETSGRIISITSVQMDPSSSGLLNLRLGIDVYYFGQ